MKTRRAETAERAGRYGGVRRDLRLRMLSTSSDAPNVPVGRDSLTAPEHQSRGYLEQPPASIKGQEQPESQLRLQPRGLPKSASASGAGEPKQAGQEHQVEEEREGARGAMVETTYTVFKRISSYIHIISKP